MHQLRDFDTLLYFCNAQRIKMYFLFLHLHFKARNTPQLSTNPSSYHRTFLRSFSVMQCLTYLKKDYNTA